ncbi:MAG TPA: deoxyguanosinetriphosphate triphosphohydrolase, partial [Hyphomicrobiaceae bacterium]|nr:deoxyguanosinetriphosphate triphosphohydrolase [Hyphomicrobiaceae bacterium]
QRDRDRIIHATAFRRLTYKTQVFVFHEGDHFRTRLTHTLEVAQIARAIARQLEIDEDLTEALALAHDLGHPPFGHAGERALDRMLAGHGGFDHNAQSLAIVTRLERKYPAFDGLNLSIETLEGLVKHNGPIAAALITPDRALGRVLAYSGVADRLSLDLFAPLEAQAAAIADDIAYNNHDVDDGLRAGLFTLDELTSVGLVGPLVEAAECKAIDRARRIYEVNRQLITLMIADVVAEARSRISAHGCASVDDVRRAGRPIVEFSDGLKVGLADLKRFLFTRVYRHPRVMRVMASAERIVEDLFRRYMAVPGDIPEPRRAEALALTEDGRALHVADFVAGMTDRFAIGEHRRLFDATPELV